MAKTVWIFPGQGAQQQDMLQEIPGRYFDLVQNVSGIDYREKALDLTNTVDVQLSTLMVELYAFEQLQQQQLNYDVVAGHSLGAFAAAVACHLMQPEQAFLLVYQRAQLMHKAYPQDYGMGVITGLTRREVAEIVEQYHHIEQPVYLSNQNDELQTTISGCWSTIDKVLQRAQHSGAGLAKRLSVPTPSHCVLMQDVADKLSQLMSEMVFNPITHPYLSNTTGRLLRDETSIIADLAQNVAMPVQWLNMLRICVELGVKHYIEMPPGQTLTNLIKRTYSDVHTYSIAQYGVDDTVYLYKKWSEKDEH